MSARHILPAVLGLAIVSTYLGEGPPPSHAALISADLFSPGDTLLTRDTATGLDWLDLTETLNQSPNSVLAGTFIQDLGFRYGTRIEVDSLFTDFGFTLILGPGVPEANFGPSTLLVDLMGCTNLFPSPCAWTSGAYDVDVVSSTVSLRMVVPNYIQSNAFIYDFVESSPGVLDGFIVGSGNFLVRSAVPEPSTLLLLVLGLAALGASTWARQGSRGAPV